MGHRPSAGTILILASAGPPPPTPIVRSAVFQLPQELQGWLAFLAWGLLSPGPPWEARGSTSHFSAGFKLPVVNSPRSSPASLPVEVLGSGAWGSAGGPSWLTSVPPGDAL